MHSNYVDQAIHSVHHVHALIHTIFTTPAPASGAAIAELMPVFAQSLSMVTTGGDIVGRDQIAQMFTGAAGARPGLEIRVSDVQVVWQQGASVALRYQEVHRLQGVETARLSLAIIEVGPTGARWHCLHETAINGPALL